MNEFWKDVLGYERLYKISNLGNLKALTDNRIENLEWCTGHENMRHAHDTGLKEGYYKNKLGKDHNQSKPILLVKDMALIEFENISRASEYLKCTVQNVSMCLRGINKSCKGFNAYYI